MSPFTTTSPEIQKQPVAKEQAAFILPYNGEHFSEGSSEIAIAINPEAIAHDGVEIKDVEKSLSKDLRGFSEDGHSRLETRVTESPLTLIDEDGSIVDEHYTVDSNTDSKIESILAREKGAVISGWPTIVISGQRDKIEGAEDLVVGAVSTILSEQMKESGNEVWLDDASNPVPKIVCLKAGEFSLAQAVREQAGIDNIDRIIRRVIDTQLSQLEAAA